jgi:hypothetical protein
MIMDSLASLPEATDRGNEEHDTIGAMQEKGILLAFVVFSECANRSKRIADYRLLVQIFKDISTPLQTLSNLCVQTNGHDCPFSFLVPTPLLHSSGSFLIKEKPGACICMFG